MSFRRERRARVAIFFGGAALAGAFGGILAFAIGKMNGIGGRQGWQWYWMWLTFFVSSLMDKMYHRIFILEGLLTVLVSLFAYFVVPTWSYKAKFVSDHTFTWLCHWILCKVDWNGARASVVAFRQRFGLSASWAFPMGVCQASIHRSPRLVLRFAFPRLCIRSVFSQSLSGKQSSDFNVRCYWVKLYSPPSLPSWDL